MIRIIFKNGDLIDCETIVKMYVEGQELEKITIVDNLKEVTDVQPHDSSSEEAE